MDRAYANGLWPVSFCQSFGSTKVVQWADLRRELASVQLSGEPDTISWKLEPTGIFSMSLIYNKMAQDIGVVFTKDLWKSTVPSRLGFSCGN